MNASEIAYVEEIEKTNAQLKDDVLKLQEQLVWFRRQVFGQRSERHIDPGSKQLFLEGLEPSKEEPQQTKTVPAHERRKPKRDGKYSLILPDDLPKERTILDLPEKEKVCPETGIPLIKIGEEITSKLAHRPGSYFIKEIVRPKYALPKEPSETGIRIAELPDSILSRCKADESLLSEIMVRKFADHLPLYRICEEFARNGIQITRQLLSQWVIALGKALEPLYNEMRKRVLESRNIFVDESTVKLLVPGKGKTHTSYVWLMVGGKQRDPPYRVYQFFRGRNHNNASILIGHNYSGFLHSDKYGAYVKLADRKQITWCPCWAHIRRKFFEAESGNLALRKWFLMKIRHLYMLERVAKKRSPKERLRIRQEKEIPIIDEITERVKATLKNGRLRPKSKLAEALRYYCGMIPHLKNYTKNAFAHIDNNVAERAIRPLAIGRKNWLFVGSDQGGQAAAVIYSLVQTCRGLNINPRTYLEDIFRRLMSHPVNRLHELLPDAWAGIKSE